MLPASYNLAVIHAQLGDKDKALSLLRRHFTVYEKFDAVRAKEMQEARDDVAFTTVEERPGVHRDDGQGRSRRGRPPMKSYHDIVGDGGSNILEQVIEQKDRIARALSKVRHRVADRIGEGRRREEHDHARPARPRWRRAGSRWRSWTPTSTAPRRRG